KQGGSDLHLNAGYHPTIRVSGSLIPLVSIQELSSDDTMGLMEALLTPENKALFLEKKEIDFSYSAQHDAVRFRGNCFFSRGSVAIALRVIPKNVRTLEDLRLPPILGDFARRQQGFFLVVGPVGHGKSTTLAALVDMINAERADHIVTIEDPIEYIFEPK